MKYLLVVVLYEKAITDLSLDFFENDECIYIYDNSPLPQNVPALQNVNVYYEHDKENNGVSRAYNQAYKKAKELGKELLLILDQDTHFKTSYIAEYFKMYELYKDNYIYAPIICDSTKTKIYSPGYMNNFVGKMQTQNNFSYEETYDLVGKSVINSGLMIPLVLFEKIGGYNEKLKLDFSDIYFIEKYKELSSKVILVNISIEHSISGDEGLDFAREYSRFKYYCSASREIGRALNTIVIWAPVRRMLRLMFKYKNVGFVKIFYMYYIKEKKV